MRAMPNLLENCKDPVTILLSLSAENIGNLGLLAFRFHRFLALPKFDGAAVFESLSYIFQNELPTFVVPC